MARQRKTYSFEKALEELERLVESMEDGALSLEQSLSSYERGMELARICQHALDEAEQRIKILTEKDGEIIEKPLETDGD